MLAGGGLSYSRGALGSDQYLAYESVATLKVLTEQGFVIGFRAVVHPGVYVARPLDQALPHYYMYQRRMILPLCNELGIYPPAFPQK